MPIAGEAEILSLRGESTFQSTELKNSRVSQMKKASQGNIHLPQIRVPSSKQRHPDDNKMQGLLTHRHSFSNADAKNDIVARSQSATSLVIPQSSNEAEFRKLRKSRSFALGVPRLGSSDKISMDFIDNSKVISDNQNAIVLSSQSAASLVNCQFRNEAEFGKLKESRLAARGGVDKISVDFIDNSKLISQNESKSSPISDLNGRLLSKVSKTTKENTVSEIVDDRGKQMNKETSLQIAVGLQEHVRRENARYNEFSSKQLIFKKWFKSTDDELPTEN